MQLKQTGLYFRWLPTDGNHSQFHRVRSCNHSYKEIQWLAWISKLTGQRLLTKFNGGQQNFGTGLQDGEYRTVLVDGFCPSTRTVYEFLGCYWHGHHCQSNRRAFAAKRNEKQRYRETIRRHKYLKGLGLKVRSIWECTWEKYLARDSAAQKYIRERFSIGRSTNKMSHADILDGIKSGSFFGLVEVDIETPDHLKCYFAELPPIFKNTLVSRSDIGSFMRNYAKKTGIMNQPRKLLISSYFGSKMLMNTALLQWYLLKGLVVTKVHQAFEFKPVSCFQKQGDTVVHHRREADVNPDKAIIAEMFKTTGNW